MPDREKAVDCDASDAVLLGPRVKWSRCQPNISLEDGIQLLRAVVIEKIPSAAKAVLMQPLYGTAEAVPLQSSETTLFCVEHEFADGRKLHVRGALVDFSNLGVPVEFFDGIVLDEAVAAVDFNSLAGDTLGNL